MQKGKIFNEDELWQIGDSIIGGLAHL